MNFNLDDPLGDILSDDDSFFEHEAKRKDSVKKTAKVKLTSSATQPKAKIEDLFGIKDPAESPKKIVVPEPKIPQSQNIQPKKTQDPATQPTKPKPVFNDDDLLSDLGFDPKKPKGGKTSILDDILGPVETKKESTLSTRPLTTGGIRKDDSKVISRQSTETTESTVPGTYTASLPPRPKTSSGRRQSITSLNDPLGFLGPSPKEKEPSEVRETRETPKVKRKGTTLDWLGLGADTKPEKEIETSPSVTLIEQKVPETQAHTMSEPIRGEPSIPNISYTPVANQSAMLMVSANLEAQNAIQAIKQQESQILLASQMKNQELALLEMQKKQQDLLAQQEMQFNDLVQKQLSRQNQLEASIKMQQDRINSHIQLLMTQPVIRGFEQELKPSLANHITEDRRDEKLEYQIEEIHLKAEVKRLELEKLRLEDLVANVNVNHEREIEFIENSHKKQIKVLEDSMQAIKSRLEEEIKELEDSYSKKFKILEGQESQIIQNYESKINTIQEEQSSIVKRLKTEHESDLEALKNEHKNMIDNIRQSKLLEFSVMQENTSYLQTLRNASSHLENVSGDLSTLRDDLYIKIDMTHKEKDQQLAAREKKLQDAERRLKLTEETSQTERTRLMELVQTLEIQLNKLSQESAEEQWTLRQKLSSLEAERTSFEREKRFAREQMDREDKRFEERKHLQLEEYQRHMQQIQDERQLLNVEKAKLETSKKLQSTHDAETSRAEIETALKVAQDATRQADQERERYFGMQRQLEAKKRELVDEENIVRQKQDELEASICTEKVKERQVSESLQRARLAERNLNAKIQFLQAQMRQFAEREARLSQDSLLLQRERFELQNFKRKVEENKCSLCRIGERSAEISQLLAGEGIQNRDMPLSRNLNFTGSNIMNSNRVDVVMDEDCMQSLKKMESLNLESGLPADLDGQVFPGQNNTGRQSPFVPKNFLDSEIMKLNFDIENNFRD